MSAERRVSWPPRTIGVVLLAALVAFGIPTAAASTPPALALNLTYITGCAPDPDNTWRVTNPNAEEVAVTWSDASGTRTGGYPAPPGASFFSTPRAAETMILRWQGGQRVKASGVDIPSDDPVCAPVPPAAPLDVYVSDPSLEPLMRELAAVIVTDLDADPGTPDQPAMRIVEAGAGPSEIAIVGCPVTNPRPVTVTDALDALAGAPYNSGTAGPLAAPDCDLDAVTAYATSR